MEFVSRELGMAVACVLGLLIGSFLNVLIYRLPRIMEREWWSGAIDLLKDENSFTRVTGQTFPTGVTKHAEALSNLITQLPAVSLSLPSSRCGSCGSKVRWFHNIPVISFLVLRAKCASCNAAISWRYPAIELITGACFAFIGYRWGLTATAACWALFASVLIAQFFIDFDTQYLPDDLNYLLLWGGLVGALAGITIPLSSAVWGAALGYLSLWAVFHIYRLLTGKEGMGYGDFKLLAALGAWFGADYLIAIILMSSVVGALMGGTLLAVGKLANKNIPIAFGPFLCGAGLLLMLVGPIDFRQAVPFIFPFQ